MSEHVHIQIRLTDEERTRWRKVAARNLPAFAAEVRNKFGEPDYAPEMPPLNGMEGFIKQPYRVLMTWVPDWAPNVDRGHFVIRIDTIVKEPKVKK